MTVPKKRCLPSIKKSLLEESLWESKDSKESWVREVASNLFIELDFNDNLNCANVRLTGGSDSGASSAVVSPSASSASGHVDKEPTHRGVHKFNARHLDEIEIDVGDAVFIDRFDDDLWSSGVNLRTGNKGIFPSCVVIPVESHSDDQVPTVEQITERFEMNFLGSIEVMAPKGNEVIREAIQRISKSVEEKMSLHASSSRSRSGSRSSYKSLKCVLEVSDTTGLTLKDSRRGQYFGFKLNDVTFCGFQDTDYFAFITKHPKDKNRLACHVFKGRDKNCRDIAESIARAFERFYKKFVDTGHIQL
jgi:hypothetical protein